MLLQLSVGEACVTHTGTICMEQATPASRYRVYVDGGYLPDGSDEQFFATPAAAARYAFKVASDLATDEFTS